MLLLLLLGELELVMERSGVRVGRRRAVALDSGRGGALGGRGLVVGRARQGRR